MAETPQYVYQQFTKKMRIDRELNTIKGLLQGIAIDDTVNPTEVASVKAWMDHNRDFNHRHPFNEIYSSLRRIQTGSESAVDEIDDIIWLCDRFIDSEELERTAKHGIQELHGVLGGIIADGKVTEKELDGLRIWMEKNDSLKTLWPYDEIEALVTSVMADRVIDDSEQQLLLGYFKEYIREAGHYVVDIPVNWDVTIAGICAVCPEISFEGKKFCFTGASTRWKRSELQALVEERGAKCSRTITQDLNFLVIGANGNPHWAYSCYGRKVEAAVEYRRSGYPIVIVHENDFWDVI